MVQLSDLISTLEPNFEISSISYEILESPKSDTTEPSSNPKPGFIVLLIFFLLACGGAAFYFFYYKGRAGGDVKVQDKEGGELSLDDDISQVALGSLVR